MIPNYFTSASAVTRTVDPRTKLFLLVIINVTVFHRAPFEVMAMMIAIPFALFFYSKKIKTALIYLLLIVIGNGAFYAVTALPSTVGLIKTILLMGCDFLHRFFPGLSMGYYLVTTTTVSEFIASLEKIKIPRNIIIPFAVMFRFFPTIAEENRSIADAMKMRGVSINSIKFIKNPFSIIEYRLVPLLVSTVKIAEELSAASLSRGLGTPGKRTYISSTHMKFQDYLTAAYAISVVILYWYEVKTGYTLL